MRKPAPPMRLAARRGGLGGARYLRGRALTNRLITRAGKSTLRISLKMPQIQPRTPRRPVAYARLEPHRTERKQTKPARPGHSLPRPSHHLRCFHVQDGHVKTVIDFDPFEGSEISGRSLEFGSTVHRYSRKSVGEDQ